MCDEQTKIELSVEVDTETAKAMEYIARFKGCTVEELVEGYLEQRLGGRPEPPNDSHS